MAEPPQPAAPLVEHFFRHEAGRLVSVLTHLFGWHNFDLVEDMVQATLVDALQAWQHRGVPGNPPAWIHRVAKNKILDALRRDKIRSRLLTQQLHGLPAAKEAIDKHFRDTQIQDTQLSMMFACCHPRLARQNQLAITLKAVCGLGAREIARALLLTEETVKKRLQRARRALIDHRVSLELPDDQELIQRLEAVHQVIYLLFNEGYCSSKGDLAIRADLCEEAVWLCYLLCGHSRFSTPPTHALMALMLFHAARLDARVDEHGALLLMEDQDRGKWDRRLIQRGQEFLDRSALGTVVSRFHLEAAIACHHCTAASYAETNWPAILRLYDALLTLHRSPVYLLNRAIVVAEIEGPRAGLNALSEAGKDAGISRYFLYDATAGEFYRRSGDLRQACLRLQAAKRKTRSPHDRAVIDRRLAKLRTSCQTPEPTFGNEPRE